MKRYVKSVFVLSIIASMLACSSDDSSNALGGEDSSSGNGKVERFVIAASSIEHQGVADYLFTAEGLESGSLSLKNNGIEQDGKNRYYIAQNNKFYSLLYNQGDPGAVTSYELDSKGELKNLAHFMTETVQVFGSINNDFVGWKMPRSGSDVAPWFSYNTVTNMLNGDGIINTEKLANNGERAHFSSLLQMGDKLVAPYFSMRGIKGDVWGTSYPNTAWIAVYDYPSMKLNKVIESNKSSQIGAFFKDAMAVDEKGDGYAYSSANLVADNKVISKNPSGILKVDGKTLEFDDSYFFDVEKVTGGYFIAHFVYAGKGNFIARLKKDKLDRKSTFKYAVLNVYNQSYKWIEGLPEGIKDLGFSDKAYYATKDGKTVYMGVTTNEGSYVYKVDADAATAKRGMKVEGGNITFISKISSK
ncbi:DUF4374 domain-containing protein [Myroides marinus]|uniref:DUF4374 domain-containing protein n=1 Tax=Myroides marinus TaxID=703342 RepID=UPI000741FE8E|nr:DUF4374 domain-containing protein [Myroides marinus]KUF43013.1 hypothetical protein AS361_02710 [Myroides marinus]MDM1369983.1 DUF4374 domain-containing protein [Myroides marinus]MDM1371638.1 DUF4374 domain-containing protein [Myroides marinus]